MGPGKDTHGTLGTDQREGYGWPEQQFSTAYSADTSQTLILKINRFFLVFFVFSCFFSVFHFLYHSQPPLGPPAPPPPPPPPSLLTPPLKHRFFLHKSYCKARLKKERKGKERKGKERKGKERKGKERKGKERKGKERKGKERKGKERKGRKDAPTETGPHPQSHTQHLFVNRMRGKPSLRLKPRKYNALKCKTLTWRKRGDL